MNNIRKYINRDILCSAEEAMKELDGKHLDTISYVQSSIWNSIWHNSDRSIRSVVKNHIISNRS